MKAQPLFKGLTRPAMIFGVPIAPFIIAMGSVLLICFYTQYIFLSILCLPLYFVLKEMTKKDSFIFRLVFLKMRFFTNPFSKKFHKGQAYSAQSYGSFSKNTLNNVEYPKLSVANLNAEPNFEKLIPFSTTIADGVVLTKEHLLVSTFELDGISFECESDDELDAKNDLLNMFCKAFANEPVSFYFHNARHKVAQKLHGNFDNEYLKEIDEKYYDGFNGVTLFKNSLFITMIYAPIGRLEKKVFSKNSIAKKEQLFKKFLKKHNEYLLRLESNLSAFNPRLLGNYEKDGNLYSKQLEFYNFILGGKFLPVRILPAQISQYLTGGVNHIYFSQDTGQISYNNDEENKFFRIIEIKDYTNATYAGILDALMYMNCEYTLTQSYEPFPLIEAKAALNKQRKQLIASEDDAVSQVEELDFALDSLASGDIGFGKYHFSLTIFGDTFEQCRKNTNEAITYLNEIGLMVATASIALPAAYFSSIPCNFTIRPRINLVSSYKFSSLIGLHNFYAGKANNNCWGEAVCILKTPNKSAYALNFHQSNRNKNDFGELFLANTLILGQSGGGKTVFMNFTFDQMQKYADPATFPEGTPDHKKKMISFYLDKDFGAKGNILAAGGRYIEIKNGVPTNFNPFWVENTPENLRQLKALMAMLVTRKDEKLNAKEEKQLGEAVEFIMREFEMHERKFPISLMLENLTEDVNDTNSLKARLSAFKKGKQFGWVFDNEIDCLDFPDDIRIYGIDGTEFLDDKDVNGILSYYILWRVMNCADGRRFVCDIDEAWKWLENEVVAEEVKNKFKTIRKQNGFLRLATQSVEDFLRLPIAKTLIEQSSTKIFLPNPLAKEDDYVKGLNLSKEEYEIIKAFIPTNRQFLVKRQDEKVIATLDLSSVGKENLMILSTGASYIDTIDKIFSQEDKTLHEKIKELKDVYKNA